MGRDYIHLDFEERCTISRLREAGKSLREIAAALDRSASSISRELKRNSGLQVGYKPVYAQEQTKARRWTGSRLERDADLRNLVISALLWGCSPAQIAGRLQLEKAPVTIGAESIYRFIDAQIRRTKNFAWRHLLPRGKSKRGWRGRRGGSPADHIKGRVSIKKRPAFIKARRQSGHWETDTLLYSRYGQCTLIAQERTSRFILLANPKDRTAKRIEEQLQAWLAPLPQQMRRSLTQDNGTEFANHHVLRDAIGIKTYFCDPHSPWQKGGIENANGRLRRLLPRKTDLTFCSAKELQAIAQKYNNTPRQCLGFKTPAELFNKQLLHFKRDSTSPPPRG